MQNEKTIVRSVIAVFLILVTSFIIAVYLVSSLKDSLTWPDIYVSDATSTGTGRVLGAIMIPLILNTIAVVISLRLVRMYDLLGDDKLAKYGLYVPACVSLALMITGLIIAAGVSVSDNNWVHWTGAVTGFATGILTLILLYLLDERLTIARPAWLKRTRIVILIVLVGTAMACAITSRLATGASAILELVTVTLFGLYIFTFAHSSEFPLQRMEG
jgi:hypothetical protein